MVATHVFPPRAAGGGESTRTDLAKSGTVRVGWAGAVAVGLVLAMPPVDVARADSGSLFRGQPSGEKLYLAACATCHGIDGRGAPRERTGLEPPLPDFTDCGFARREPDQDWLAVIYRGGPARGFDELMPAFEHALTPQEIDRLVAHMRGFCRDHVWPKGELNVPRALVVEKAFPEDEVVLTTEVTLEGRSAVSSEFVYEKRVGPLDQLELVVPFSVQDSGKSGTLAGLGDVGVGWKRVLVHGMRTGSILSVLGEVFLPTGIAREGFGTGTVSLEPSLLFGQYLRLSADVVGFVQLQSGVGLPWRTTHAGREFFGRAALGMAASETGWGRMWSPMLELQAVRGLERGAATEWDAIPQLQVTLSRRRHVRLCVGMRRPLTGLGSRPLSALGYLLWDWYDGGLFDGW